MSEEPIRGGYYGPREICIAIGTILLVLAILSFVTDYPNTIGDYSTYLKMKSDMNTTPQIAQGIVTDMDCCSAYGFGVTINGERLWFDIAGECVPLLEYNESYTIYWYWGVVGYGAGGCCRYARYVNRIEDKNGERVPFAIKWCYWEEYMEKGVRKND